MNIFDLEDLSYSEEVVNILSQNKDIRIERIISTGQTTDWYDQDEFEYVILIQGSAVIEYEQNEDLKLNAGDNILINPHEKHRVKQTSVDPPCIWICMFWR